MACYPNGDLLRHSPGRFSAGVTAFLPQPADGSRRAPYSGVIIKTAGVPDGYGADSHIPPYKAGAMSSWNKATLTGTGSAALIMGGPVAGTFTASGSLADASLSLVVSCEGTWTADTAWSADLASTLALAGNATLALSADASLAIIDPMSGSFSVSFSAEADVRGKLSMSGEWSTSSTQQTVEYGGMIFLSEWGSDGYTYPSGTATQPVATIACATALCRKYNLRQIMVNGSHTLTDDYEYFTFVGWGSLVSCSLTLTSGSTLFKCLFRDLGITGDMTDVYPLFPPYLNQIGTLEFRGCYVRDLDNASGNYVGCQLTGDINIKPGKYLSAADTIIEGDETFFDLGSTSGTTLSMDVTSGWVQIENMVAGCLAEFNFKGGEITFHPSCTGGSYYLEGVGTIFDETGGALTKKENHFIWNEDATYVNELGSTGELLNGAGAAGDPWIAPIGIEVRERLGELWTIKGLDIANPLTVTPAAQVAAAITLTMAGDGTTTTTVTRTA